MVLFNTSVALTQMQALKDSSFIGVAGCTLPKIFLERIGNKIAVSQPKVTENEKNMRKKYKFIQKRFWHLGILTWAF